MDAYDRIYTHEVLIDGEWKHATFGQFVTRRRGLPRWGYRVRGTDRAILGKAKERLEAAGHVRKRQILEAA